jgi:hypothetical protein
MRCLYRERRYECGDYLEVDVYPVYKTAKQRNRQAKPTSEVQEKLNQRNSERELIRVLNANFTREDLEIHLTFEDHPLPESYEEAKRMSDNFMRRVKYRYTKAGIELKYVVVISGDETHRWHYHITLSGGIDRDELEALWPYGYANSRRLQFNENGVEGLSRYISRQHLQEEGYERAKGRRRWFGSRNLVRPQPKEVTGAISGKKVKELCTVEVESREPFERMYPGWYLSRVEGQQNEVNGGYYLHIRMYRAGTVFGAQKRKKAPSAGRRAAQTERRGQ